MFKGIFGLSVDRDRVQSSLLWIFLGISLIVVVLAAWGLWAWFGVQYFADLLCQGENCEKLAQVGDIFGGINALFAGLAFLGLLLSLEHTRRANQEERARSSDKELVEQVRNSYEWAFNLLHAQNSMVGQVPLNYFRLNWLGAARHLVRARRLVDKLETDTYQLVQQEIAEFWRGKFHEMLNEGNGFSWVLNVNSNLDSHDRISPVSISVILEFAAWPHEMPDPLDGLGEKFALRNPAVQAMSCFHEVEQYFDKAAE